MMIDTYIPGTLKLLMLYSGKLKELCFAFTSVKVKNVERYERSGT